MTAPIQSTQTVSIKASAPGYVPTQAALSIAPSTAAPLICTLGPPAPTPPLINKSVRLILTCTRDGIPAAGVNVDWGLFIGGLSAVTTLNTTQSAAGEVRRAANATAAAAQPVYGAIAAAQCTNAGTTPTGVNGTATCDTPALTAPTEVVAVYSDANATAQEQTAILTPVLPLSCKLVADPFAPEIGGQVVLTTTCTQYINTNTPDVNAKVANVNIQWTNCTGGDAVTDANGQARCTAGPIYDATDFGINASLSGYQDTSAQINVTPVEGPAPVCTLSAVNNPVTKGPVTFDVYCEVNGVPLSGAQVNWDVYNGMIVISPMTVAVFSNPKMSLKQPLG
jgi:hypothetical protein